ncbi:MAG: LON peptidase substrate-binding domain-containing protein [Steroidobacteraceae bacterium]
MPLFPLQTVLFPGGPLPLRIFEPRYVDMVGRCMRTNTGFGVVLIVEGGETGGVSATADIGTAASIEDFSRLPDGLLGLMCRGGRRFRLLDREREADGLNVGTIEWLDEPAATPLPPQFQPLAQLLERVLPELGALYANSETRFDDADWVGCRLAEILPIEPGEKQRLLEETDPLTRLVRLAPLLRPVDDDEPPKEAN